MADIKLPFVLGLAGRKGVGKTHIARGLEERGWVRMSYADGVRELALALDPYVDWFDPGTGQYPNIVGLPLSDLVGDRGWDKAKENPEVRRILQVVGTEIGRSIDPDIWVNKLAARIYKLPAGSRVVIDDVRFPNEADKIRHAWGGVVVHLNGEAGDDTHESERLVDTLDVTYDIPEMSVRAIDWAEKLDWQYG